MPTKIQHRIHKILIGAARLMMLLLLYLSDNLPHSCIVRTLNTCPTTVSRMTAVIDNPKLLSRNTEKNGIARLMANTHAPLNQSSRRKLSLRKGSSRSFSRLPAVKNDCGSGAFDRK